VTAEGKEQIERHRRRGWRTDAGFAPCEGGKSVFANRKNIQNEEERTTFGSPPQRNEPRFGSEREAMRKPVHGGTGRQGTTYASTMNCQGQPDKKRAFGDTEVEDADLIDSYNRVRGTGIRATKRQPEASAKSSDVPTEELEILWR